MARQEGTGSPYPPPPRSPTAPRPKSQQDPGKPASDGSLTLPETGRTLPIVHGTAKTQGTIIEQYSSIVYAGPISAPPWQTNYGFSVGDRTTANGNTYVCTVGGISATSGTGPSGTGTGIIDGNTSVGLFHQDTAVRWDFVRNGMDINWRPSTAYTVNLLTTVVSANGNIYVCVGSGTSAATGSGPSGTGTGITDGTCTWNYMPPGWRTLLAAAFCEGQIFGAKGGWSDGGGSNAYERLANDFISLQLGTGSGGGRPALFPVPDAIFADLYSNTAVLYLSSLTAMDRKTSNVALEIISGTGVSDTVPDENPADIVIDLLTHARRGAGWSASRVDTAGTLAIGVASSYRNYCAANGFVLSWVIDTQAPAMELLGLLLLSTNSDAVWSGGKLKFFPRSDQAITANGATYTPNLSPAYNLGPDDIIGVVEVIERRSGALAFNDIPIEYTDRVLGYVRNTVDDPDMADVDKRGLLRAPTLAIPHVMSQQAAIMLSRIMAQRSLKVRNTYRFRLPYRFFLLDPCDIVTLTDPVSGLASQPVRITVIEEDQVGEGSFVVEAEDFPAAVSAAAQYTTQGGDGFRPSRGTALQQAMALPANVPLSTVTDSSTTRAAAVHNVWPNGSSESDSPDGANLATAEWAGRVNAGAGAFAGNWVREISATKGQSTPTIIGDRFQGNASFLVGDSSAIHAKVRCSPGDTFYLEAQSRFTAIGTGGTAQNSISIRFLDAAEAISGVFGAGGLINGGSPPTAWVFSSVTATAPSAACWVFFVLGVHSGGVTSGTVTAQYDAIVAYRKVETSSDAASNAPSLALAAGGNTFTDIPGTSQSFIPNTVSRKIKVSLVFSGFATGASGDLKVRIVFGGTPTQAGVTYTFAFNTMNQHQSWAFMWVLAAAALGPVGTAVTVKAQVESATLSPTAFNMSTQDDYATMVVEEIG